MVLEGSRKTLQEHVHLKFKDFGIGKFKRMISDDMVKAREGFCSKVEGKISDALKSGTSVVVEGPLTVNTPEGYFPLVPKEFFESFSPEVFVIFELPGKNTKVDILQQEVDRTYSEMYASLAGSPLKIIEVGSNDVKSAIKDFRKVMVSFLGK